MQKIGFIGCGKMASAIIKGSISSGFILAENIMATKFSENNLEKTSKDLGIRVILDNKTLVQKSDIIFLAVKPNQTEFVLNEIKDLITNTKLIVSVAAGITTTFIESILGKDSKIIRVMPNTPSTIGEGICGICKGKNVSSDEIELIQNIFNTFGKSIIIDENQMDIVTAISGSGPAFFYKIINDIARAGEKLGLEYDKALLLSIQTAIGAAKMAEKRTITMEELINNVATKGGCTRVGIDTMENSKLEYLLFNVIKDTAEKAHALGK